MINTINKNQFNVLDPQISTIIYMVLYYYTVLTAYVLSRIPNLTFWYWSLNMLLCFSLIALTPYLYIKLSNKLSK